MKHIRTMQIVLFIGLLAAAALPQYAQQKRLMTFEDMLKFRTIESPVIADNAEWVAFEARPDRGDGELVVTRVHDGRNRTIARGSKPRFSNNTQWLGAIVNVAFDDSKKKDDKKIKQGFALLNLQNDSLLTIDSVASFAFAEDSRWLAVLQYKREFKQKKNKKDSSEASEGAKAQGEGSPQNTDKDSNALRTKHIGGTLMLRNLAKNTAFTFDFVTAYAFDTTARYLVYAVADTAGTANGLYALALSEQNPLPFLIDSGNNRHYTELSWNNRKGTLAYLRCEESEKEVLGTAALYMWNPQNMQARELIAQNAVPRSWVMPAANKLEWSIDGTRLYFGYKPALRDSVERALQAAKDAESKDDKDSAAKNIYDMAAIRDKAECDVWHWRDSLINPHQKKQWQETEKKTFRAVVFPESGRSLLLEDESTGEVLVAPHAPAALQLRDAPYRHEITWNGWFSDVALLDMQTGQTRTIAGRLDNAASSVSLAPSGRYAVYYRDSVWYLYTAASGETRALSATIPTPFYDEEFDYPRAAECYGAAGWTENDKAVLIYDRYDIWYFPTEGGTPRMITDGEGRRSKRRFRIRKLDEQRHYYSEKESLLLEAYHDSLKHDAMFTCVIASGKVTKLLEEAKLFRVLGKAKGADRILYTRQSFAEFPDLWLADMQFRNTKKISEANPQLQEFKWGSSELVEWQSLDGRILQGVLIKPADYDPNKRYPLIVYFYRLMSSRLHDFNTPNVSDRINLPYYAARGYCVLLPDIVFEVGRPGQSAVKCIVPGVQKLVEAGIVDAKRVGLHGHSWSGYQTAYIITQTDIFAAAIAGAPVSNMTSAYGGIRWGSGLARQFQYEQYQSRLGGSLWEYPMRYLENSPLFYADRVNTPLLIMHGDDDGAVPWYQAIELYLALRRNNKNCIFLQYRGEPHHLRKPGNQLDYCIRMQEYFDHYLLGAPAADWMLRGEPYRGK